MDRRERIISENIRAARIKHKLTLEKFSEEIGITTNFLYRIEAGTARMSLQTLLRIQEVLDLDGNILLGITEPPNVVDATTKELKQIVQDCKKEELETMFKLLEYIRTLLENTMF